MLLFFLDKIPKGFTYSGKNYLLSCLRKFLDEQRIENVIGLFSRYFLWFVDSPQVKNN